MIGEIIMRKKVAILMGSDSDYPVVKDAIDTLNDFEVFTSVHIISAHRTPIQATQLASKAKENGYGVIICAAGKAAHLAGVIAAHTTLPVIGLPIKSSTMDGMDSLLSTVQMPSGVPVATVAINGSKNAAILAVQILAIGNDELDKKLEQMKSDMEDEVIKKNEKLQNEL